MSKELEMLEELYIGGLTEKYKDECFKTIAKALNRLIVYDIQQKQTDEFLDSAREKLKALEIIKEMDCFKFYEIDGQYYVSGISVPKEKFDLLKEVLK